MSNMKLWEWIVTILLTFALTIGILTLLFPGLA
jgi:hypothetical protein